MPYSRNSSWRLPLVVRPTVIHVAVVCAGVVLALTPILVVLKLDHWARLQWWAVLLPIAAVLFGVLLAFTVAGLTWILTAWRLFAYPQSQSSGLNLDALLRTAKICVLGHGYVMLLIIAYALLLAKLYHWPDLSAVYVLLPLIVLGTFYIFVAVMFKQPEVDVGLSFFVGVVLLSQCVMLSIKLDYFRTSNASLSWAVTFSPSWIAYFIMLVSCGYRSYTCVLRIRGDDSDGVEPDGNSAISGRSHRSPANLSKRSDRTSPRDGGTGVVDGEGVVADATQSCHAQGWRPLMRLVALAAAALGFGVSQALLTLRLDGVTLKASWPFVVAPGLAGWLLLLAFAADLVSVPTAQAARLVYDPRLANGDANDWDDEEKAPLLPWR